MSEKPCIVMDTNVAVVANGQAEQASPECVRISIGKLRRVQGENRILLDDRHCIIDEYRKRLSPSGQPGSGDAFFKWLWQNQANPQHCREVPVTSHPTRGFVEFPDDPELSSFDWDDRKFVAVAQASGENPGILNAADTDWWHHHDALQRYGVVVCFICPELMSSASRGRAG